MGGSLLEFHLNISGVCSHLKGVQDGTLNVAIS